MKVYILPIALQIIGMLVIIAEIFIPSLGLLTLIALGIFAYSLTLVFTSVSPFAGMIFTGLDIVLVPCIILTGMKILAKSPLSLKQELSKQDGVVSQKPELKSLINQEGVAATDLRPAGMALINSQRLDVVTDGEYVDKKSSIIVTGISGNRIIVEKTK